METKRETVVARGWGEGDGELPIKGRKVSIPARGESSGELGSTVLTVSGTVLYTSCIKRALFKCVLTTIK